MCKDDKLINAETPLDYPLPSPGGDDTPPSPPPKEKAKPSPKKLLRPAQIPCKICGATMELYDTNRKRMKRYYRCPNYDKNDPKSRSHYRLQVPIPELIKALAKQMKEPDDSPAVCARDYLK